MSLSALSARERAACICADFQSAPKVFDEHESLVFGAGEIDGARVYVLAQDARMEGGSFGVAESRAAAQWFTAIADAPAPVILWLDSGGARMSEGLAALGGFRELFRAAADAWLAGAPMLLVCGKTVFGGASMLACLAETKLFFERSLFGMSGPRIVQAVAGRDDFDAGDKALVRSVMGGAARAGRAGAMLIDESEAAVRSGVSTWLRSTPRINAADRLHAMLIAQRQQLEQDGLTRAPNPVFVPSAQIANTAQIALRNAWVDNGVLIGRAENDAFVYGIINGKWADSWDAWTLANALLSQSESAPKVQISVFLDCPAHATSRALEAGVISQYFTLLGLALRHLHASGATVTLHIVGDAAGGVHVALAGAATHVIAHPGANIRILPRIAIDQVRPDAQEAPVTPSQWVESGVVDVIVPESFGLRDA